MRNIPIKNYFILGIIILVSGIVSIILMETFHQMDNKKTENAFKNKLSYSELETYILENSDSIIYFIDHSFSNSKFEKKFKKYVVKNDLVNSVIYVDREEFDESSFIKFVSKYSETKENIEFSDYIFIIDNQRIVSSIPIKNDMSDMSFLTKIFKEKEVL